MVSTTGAEKVGECEGVFRIGPKAYVSPAAPDGVPVVKVAERDDKDDCGMKVAREE